MRADCSAVLHVALRQELRIFTELSTNRHPHVMDGLHKADMYTCT
jgi:hypothetical protein